jgi:phosphoribosylglycinamide formyltransferase-1
MAKRLVILISGSGSNLQAFIDAIQAGALDAEIACVISNKPGVLGLERASKAGIPTAVLVHQDFASREDYDKTLLTEVQQYAPDLVILAGFMRILTPAFVTPLYGKLINIHPSLLPKYPGLHTHQRALDAGDSEAGVTVHFVSAELDGGPVIIQARVRYCQMTMLIHWVPGYWKKNTLFTRWPPAGFAKSACVAMTIVSGLTDRRYPLQEGITRE